MLKKYKLPIRGTVLKREPLQGLDADPISVIPLTDIAGFPTGEGVAYTCLQYNIDEGWCEVELEASDSFHLFLESKLPGLPQLAKDKGYTLDKSKLGV